MNKTAIRLAAVAAVAGLGIAGCSSSKKTGTGTSTTPASNTSSQPAPSSAGTSTGAAPSASSAASGIVGVILPDTQSSPRWESQDRPNLQQAITSAGLKADIQNAQGDTTKFVQIAQSMIQEGAKVIILAAIDSSSGAQAEQLAAQAGVKTIDYDRLVLGGADNYYVSFDNVEVGKLQGQGLVDCLTAANVAKPWKIIELKGAPTDNNATLFAQGYDGVLDPLYANGTAKKLGEQAVPNWGSKGEAGPIFEQMLTAGGGKVDGVIGANDSMGQQVLTIEQKHGIKAPVTGQDASVQGLQAVLSGAQCGTVFKDTSKEAAGAAELAIDLMTGKDPGSLVNGKVNDGQTKKDVPSVLETPEWVTADKVEDVVKANQQKASDICTGSYAALCTKYGVS